jgi:hypothetical protein
MTKQAPLVINLLNAIGVVLGQQLNIKQPVLTTSNNPVQQYLNRADGREDKQVIDYPMFWTKPRGFQLNHQSPYSPSRMAKSPLTELYAPVGEGTYQSIRLIPAVYTVECTYLTNDTEAAWQYAAQWVALSRSGKIDFNFSYLGILLSIYVELTDQVDIPEFDQGEDINHVQVTTTLTAHGYVELPGAQINQNKPSNSSLTIGPTPANISDNPDRYITYSAVGSYANPVLDAQQITPPLTLPISND